jgi:2-oxoisovalerate dehydrogenase E1 component
VREGQQCTIVTYGLGVHWALHYLDQHTDVKADLIDLRTLAPLDTQTIFESAKKTGRVLVLHEDNLTGGIGGEISALITEHCFEYLDAPVVRCASMDTPIPFNAELEKQYLANAQLEAAMKRLLNF